jgi:hypothetical protein
MEAHGHFPSPVSMRRINLTEGREVYGGICVGYFADQSSMECHGLRLPSSTTTLSRLREAELGNREGVGKAKKGHASGGQDAGDVMLSESPNQKFGMTSESIDRVDENAAKPRSTGPQD